MARPRRERQTGRLPSAGNAASAPNGGAQQAEIGGSRLSLGSVSTSLPMFPLNAVIFPGVSVPLNVFEDRYRALVHHLLRVEDPTQRLFGSVGSARATRSASTARSRCSGSAAGSQLTEVESQPDGTFSIVARGPRPDPARAARHLRGVPGRPGRGPPGDQCRGRRGAGGSGPARRSPPTAPRWPRSAVDPYTGDLPQDPSYLSWTLAACAPLPLHERQALLEAEDAADRLRLVTDLLRTELRAMNVLPSLPATDVARTRWSPN